MSVSRKKALDYAEQLISRPRSELEVVLRQTKSGVTLLHKRRALTKCYLTRTGMRAATYMARALAVKVPPLGESVSTSVSSGVLWRVISISDLDLRKEKSYPILERLLAEAEMMRSGSEGV